MGGGWLRWVGALARVAGNCRANAPTNPSHPFQGVDTSPALLVDGYNILFRWLSDPKFAQTKEERERVARASRSLEKGRDMLTRDLDYYSGLIDLRLVVAWDAIRGPGGRAAGIVRTRSMCGTEIVFCGDREADSFLTSESTRLLAAGAPRVVVATSDVAVQMSLEWGAGASYMDADELLTDVHKVRETGGAQGRRGGRGGGVGGGGRWVGGRVAEAGVRAGGG